MPHVFQKSSIGDFTGKAMLMAIPEKASKIIFPTSAASPMTPNLNFKVHSVSRFDFEFAYPRFSFFFAFPDCSQNLIHF